MKIQFGVFLMALGIAVSSWNLANAAPPTVAVTPLVNTISSGVVSSPAVNATLPPAGGQMSAGGVGGQFSSMRPGGQFMPGSAPGGQLAPGQIPGGTSTGMIPALPAFNLFFPPPNFGQPLAPNRRVIVTGNSLNTTAPGGMISGSGVGGNSRVIVTGRNTMTAPGGAISGNGVGGSRVIVTGSGSGNSVTTPTQSNVIVTGNTLTGAGVGGTNTVPVLR